MNEKKENNEYKNNILKNIEKNKLMNEIKKLFVLAKYESKKESLSKYIIFNIINIKQTNFLFKTCNSLHDNYIISLIKDKELKKAFNNKKNIESISKKKYNKIKNKDAINRCRKNIKNSYDKHYNKNFIANSKKNNIKRLLINGNFCYY